MAHDAKGAPTVRCEERGPRQPTVVGHGGKLPWGTAAVTPILAVTAVEMTASRTQRIYNAMELIEITRNVGTPATTVQSLERKAWRNKLNCTPPHDLKLPVAGATSEDKEWSGGGGGPATTRGSDLNMVEQR
jgi:hypothetical protein